MGEQTDGNQRTAVDVRYRWVAHSTSALGLWELEEWSDGTQGRHVVAVLMAGGPDDHGVIRFPRRLAEQQTNEAGRPYWEADGHGRRGVVDYPVPPSWREVATAYDAFQPPEERFTAHLEHPRRPDESADDFYYRIARLYKAYARTNGKPVRSIADALGAEKTTVGNWITAARKRGYLPPTTKGKVQA